MVLTRTRSVPLRRSRRRFSPPSVRYEPLLSLCEQGSLHLGQGSLLEALDGSLYLVDGVALTREVVGTLSVREGVALVLSEGAKSIVCSPGYPHNRRGEGRMKLVGLDHIYYRDGPVSSPESTASSQLASEKTRIVSLPGRLSVASSCRSD